MSLWKLETLDAAHSYVFEVAPNAMEAPLPQQGVVVNARCVDGQFRGFRQDSPRQWSFDGVLLEKTQYDALGDWVTQQGRCFLYDHLDRKFLVRLTAFLPVRAPRANHPWRHTYRVNVTTYKGPL